MLSVVWMVWMGVVEGMSEKHKLHRMYARGENFFSKLGKVFITPSIW